jgi:peroxiredoxin
MKQLVILFAGLLLITACDTGKQYRLSGSVEGASDVSIHLQQRIDKAYVSIDSVTSPEGTFEFSGSVDIPDVYYISLSGGRGKAMVFLENSDISLYVHKDSMFNPRVSGSDVHDEYMDFQSGIDAVYEKLDALYEEYREATQKGDTAIASELEMQMETVYGNVGNIQMEYLDAHPASYISPYIAQSLHYGKEVDEIEELLAKLDPSLGITTIVENLESRVEVLKSVAVGKIAPDFTQNDPEGNPVSLSSFLGSYLLLDFWASWCGPCRRENPHVVEAYREFHDRGLEILGVSLDNSREKWLQAIEADKLTWTQVSELNYWSNSAVSLYGISSIPSNLLLDPDGRIIAKNLRGNQLHEELSKYLAP